MNSAPSVAETVGVSGLFKPVKPKFHIQDSRFSWHLSFRPRVADNFALPLENQFHFGARFFWLPRTAIAAAQTASNQSNTDSGIAHNNFLNGIQAGRDRLTGLRTELEQLISDDDDRWYAFGFDKPSDPNTPAVPANLTVVPGAPGSKIIIADWDNARRADIYRLCAALKTDGTEQANEITSETQFTLTLSALASGTIVVLTVTARNDTAESGPSDPVEIAMP